MSTRGYSLWECPMCKQEIKAMTDEFPSYCETQKCNFRDFDICHRLGVMEQDGWLEGNDGTAKPRYQWTIGPASGAKREQTSEDL